MSTAESTMTAIASRFAQLKEKGHMAFMPFVTAGDPDLATTLEVIQLLAEQGVDMIEVGFPYSDPIADGPVIQSSYTRALKNHITVEQIFTHFAKLDAAHLPPLVAMVSYAIIFRTGIETFLTKAKASGFAGLIVPDLPADEAEEFAAQVKPHHLDLIQLLAPTSTPERTQHIVNTSTGFVYCIAVAGTTGVREKIADELITQLKAVRQLTDLPLAVGFGISQPEHVAPLRGIADGVIVGSALVKYFEQMGDADKREETLTGFKQLAKGMCAAVHR